MTKKQRSDKKRKTNLLILISIIGMFLAGIGVFSYPFYVDSLNNYLDQKMMTRHQREVAERNRKNQEEALERMRVENEKRQQSNSIAGVGLLEDLFDTTDFEGNHSAEYYEDHLLGALYIPKIRASLPIFSETNEALLEKGTTLLQGTSYPIGGDNTHSVITGHTGLPEKMIFTDLEKLQYGDQFYIDVLGERLAYEVDQIQVVLPDRIDVLAVQEGRDLVTLLTCTPYMINSHRLLVTGVRIPYEEEMAATIQQTKRFQFWRLVGLTALALTVLGAFLYWIWRKIVLVRAAKKTYTLNFSVPSSEVPTTFQLLERNKPLLQNGQPVIAKADAQGNVSFAGIPGGIYQVVNSEKPDAWPKIKVKIWRVKDQTFRLQGPGKLFRRTKTGGSYHYSLARKKGSNE